MIRMGYDYVERLDKAGALEPYLSGRVPAAPACGAGSQPAQLSQSLGSMDAAVHKASVMDLHIYQL